MTAHQQIAYRRLFKNHSGVVGYWEGWVEPSSEGASIILQYARSLEGKVTRRETPATPKNVGRSNETTALEQAQLELDSRTNKQLDKGYVEKAEDATKPSVNTLGFTKPMLAQPLDKVKPEQIDWNTTYCQPKLDGHRAMYKDGVLYSRQGKELNLPHIVEAIQGAGLDQLHLDGEIYLHGKTLQEISSLVKRTQPGTEELVYHIYDVVSDKHYAARLSIICNEGVVVYDWPQAIEMLESHEVYDKNSLMAYHEQNLSAGYEGTMLRWGDEGYQDGKRSKHLLKLKNFTDSEYRIIGAEMGVPYIRGEEEFSVPVWVLDAGEGKTFTATAQGDMYEKHELWETRDQHIGKLLTVKHHGKSKDDIPQLPVSLRFREDI